FDREGVSALEMEGRATPAALIGAGRLAFTIDRAGSSMRHQGLVALEGEGLEAAAHEYFLRSEQIPTRVRLAAAQTMGPGGASNWRAGGVLAQFLPAAPERRRRDLDPGDAPTGWRPEPEDDAWLEAQALMSTIEDH